MCFFKHKWGKWEAPVTTNPDDEGNINKMQVRTCDRCGLWQRRMCYPYGI